MPHRPTRAKYLVGGGQQNPSLNLTSKPSSLALRVNRAVNMITVWQGMRIDHLACSKIRVKMQQMVKILALYNKIPKQLRVGNMECHHVDQEERYLQLQVLFPDACELFRMIDRR